MAKKTFPYAVIYGGEIIPANTPIEVKEEKAEAPAEEKAEAPAEEKPKKRGVK